MNTRGKSDQEMRAWLARYSGLGLQFALTLGVFTFGGYWLDRQLDWLPWGTLAGAFIGFAGATTWAYREVFPPEDKKKAP